MHSDNLFRLVEEYAALGPHRSGTSTQRATAVWLADQLSGRGAAVELIEVAFERYVADWSVSIEGEQVEALPLFYETVGSAKSRDPARLPAFAPSGSGPLGVSSRVEDIDVNRGEIVVAATQNLLGLLSVTNRTPGAGSGVHVLQVAGHHGGALAAGAPVEASISAHLEAATCPNVIAQFGPAEPSNRLTVVTTPISGWFACAGERGTGIAAALEVASTLADEIPVVFMGATGHEFGAFGAAEFSYALGDRVDTLIHVGANIGCDWKTTAELAPPDHTYMAARYAGPETLTEPLRAAFAPTGHGLDTPPRDRSNWFGEAAEWLDTPVVLSLLGQNPWFHAPSDLPGVSCTSERTELVTEALTEAALALVHR